ncbi:MAG TPA: hypothetical protein VMI31_13620 [Fimbriimonadaceae bacterium]|nr:hypothetical protein [Fimbriimonadaceae bacterium]
MIETALDVGQGESAHRGVIILLSRGTLIAGLFGSGGRRNARPPHRVKNGVGKPYVISGTSKGALVFTAVLTLLVAGVAAGAGFLGASGSSHGLTLGLQFEFGLLALLGVAGWTRSFLMRKVRWVIDDDSIRMENGARVVWRCAWEDYGGWRTAKRLSLGEWMDSLAWYEILDRSGRPVGRIHLGRKSSRSAQIRRELQRNTPEGGEQPQEPAEWKPKPGDSVARQRKRLYAGIACCVAGCVATRAVLGPMTSDTPTPFSDWLAAHPWFSLVVTCPIGVGAFVAGFAALHLLQLKELRLAAPGPPSYGPTLSDFRLDRGGLPKPIDLVDGEEYIYVDSEALRRRMDRDRMGYSGLKWLSVAPLVLIAIPGAVKVESAGDLWSIPAIAAAFGGGAVGCWLAERNTQRRQSRLGDRIAVRGDRLHVVREGVETTYPWPPRRARGDLKRKEGFAYRLQLGDPVAYEIDPRYLLKAPTEADLAEIQAANLGA